MIFLAPVSGTKLFFNYQRTVVEGINYNDFKKLPGAKKFDKLLVREKKILIWGIKNSKIGPFQKCKTGDFVFFYHKGIIISFSIIKNVGTDRELSEKIWGRDFDDMTGEYEYWENLLFLSESTSVKINYKIMIEFAGYKEKASVRGFNKYSDNGIDSIELQYGSIENFLKHFTV